MDVRVIVVLTVVLTWDHGGNYGSDSGNGDSNGSDSAGIGIGSAGADNVPDSGTRSNGPGGVAE